MKQSLEDMLAGMRVHPVAQPSEQFIKNARIRVLNLAEKTEDKVAVVALKRRLFLFPLRFAAIGALAGLTLGTTVVYAAQSSLPGSLLYPVKVASETVALGFAPTSSMKTEIAGAVIDRRAEEVTELKTYATDQEVNRAFSEYQRAVGDIRKMRELNQSKIEEHIREHENLLDWDKDGSSSGRRHSNGERTLQQQEEQEHPSTGSLVPTPTLAVVPSVQNADSATTSTTNVLGTHEGGGKHQNEGRSDD